MSVTTNRTRKMPLSHIAQTIILIGSHFDEEAVIHCLCRMRDAGITVSLVSPSLGWLTGMHGVRINSDFSLNQAEEMVLGFKSMLVLPGPGASVTQLLCDPRVHQLVQDFLAADGFVAAFSSAQAILIEANLLVTNHSTHILSQGNMSVPDFVSRLIQQIAV